MTDEDMIARLREALTMIDVGEGWAAQIARAALAYSAPQSTPVDDKIGPDAVAKPDPVAEAARIDPAEIERAGKRWHGEDYRIVSVRWEPYKPEGQRQMKAKGRWQESYASGDWFRWSNMIDRPSNLRAIGEASHV